MQSALSAGFNGFFNTKVSFGSKAENPPEGKRGDPVTNFKNLRRSSPFSSVKNLKKFLNSLDLA